jgi:biopolymer transport protein ExbD
MGARIREGDAALVTDINVTPLVDVVLVLLVLMMVTATAIANKTIALEAPRARSGAADGKKKPLVVAVDEQGRLYLGDVPAGDEEVRTRARELTGGGDTEAVLAADGRARHAAVVHAMDLLRSERVSKIAVVVRSEEAR